MSKLVNFFFFFAVQLIILSLAQEKPCNLQQFCAGHDKPNQGTCDNPGSVNVPYFVPGGYEPQIITDPVGITSMGNACPFLDVTKPLCCNSDTAQIMEYNYRSLDAVFKTDCPVCAVNLKTMWCEYACNPDKSSFLRDNGNKTTDGQLYRLVGFTLDSDYACGIFTSCKKVSYIAQAGISSSLAFLDFMGTNGQDYSLSVITFSLANNGTGLMPRSDAEPYDCGMDVPANETVNGYTNTTNSTCSYCDAACEAPAVNDDIAFLDGLNWVLVGSSYAGFIAFTIIFQLVVHFCCNRSKRAELDAQNDSQAGSNLSGNQGKYANGGKPVNMTTSEASKTNMSNDKLLE